MSCVKYMVTGSSKIDQSFIDEFKNRGVQKIANWYGMTEAPPPVMIGYDSPTFDLGTINQDRWHVMFRPLGEHIRLAECMINGVATGDIFDMETMQFHSRKDNSNGKTWKNNFQRTIRQ